MAQDFDLPSMKIGKRGANALSTLIRLMPGCETMPGTNRRVDMMKVVYVLRIIAAILVVGTVGSIEIDRIDLWTGNCRVYFGITLWLLTGYWIEELKSKER